MAFENEIQKIAYKLYLKRGRREGNALDDWLKAEKMVFRKRLFLKYLRYSFVFLLFGSSIIWFAQRKSFKNEETLKRKSEVMKMILPLYATYYEETWNRWHALKDKQPPGQSRANVQRIAAEAGGVQAQILLLFKDKVILEDWGKFLEIFSEINYSITRGSISEEKLNEQLNSTTPIIQDLFKRIYCELR